MIRVTLGNGLERKNVTVTSDTTLKAAIEQNGFSLERNYTLNGASLAAGEVNKTFGEMGCTDTALLIAVAKADNA